MDNTIGKIMDMMDKYEWMTAAIANYLITHDIDVETIPEMN